MCTATRSHLMNAIPFSTASRAAAIAVLLGATHSVSATPDDAPSYLPAAGEVYRMAQFEVNGKAEKNAYSVQRSLTATKTDTALLEFALAAGERRPRWIAREGNNVLAVAGAAEVRCSHQRDWLQNSRGL